MTQQEAPSLLGEDVNFFNFLGTTEISGIFRLSVYIYIYIVLLKIFQELSKLSVVLLQIIVKLFNTYSMKQADLYYFETIKMTSQAESYFVWRIRAAGEYSL